MSKVLSGKVALVTGGSRGLGVAVAGALADQGADVAITYNASADRAMAVVEAINAKGGHAIALKADQGDPAAAEPLVRRVVDSFGRLDILVNNAAVARQGKRIDDSEIDNAELDRMWTINTMGVVANIRAAAKVLPDGGRIISVGTGMGTRAAFPGAADYGGSKAAIVGYSKGVARDLGPRNITVNVVQAGMLDTEMTAAVKDHLPAIIMESHAIPRFAALSEVAAAVVFLAGPDAGFITGSVIDVNGGYTA